MSYYADLSLFDQPGSSSRITLLHIGWLDRDYPFETAVPEQWIIKTIWAFSKFSVHESRGYHECNLTRCPGPSRKDPDLYLDRFEKVVRRYWDKFHHPDEPCPCDDISPCGGKHSPQTPPPKLPGRTEGKRTLGVYPGDPVRLELGSSQILVFGGRKKGYLAPNMLYHYVANHHYKLPDEFVRALRRSPCPPEPLYFKRLDALGIDWVNTRRYDRSEILTESIGRRYRFPNKDRQHSR